MEPSKEFGIVITARMRHADLWEAAKKCGSNSEMARQLGVTPSVVGNWINLKSAPGDKVRDKYEPILLVMTGKSWDELWPPELREAIKGGDIGKQMAARRDVSMRWLTERTSERLTLPAPDKELAMEDARDAITKAIDKLQSRDREVLELSYGLNGQDDDLTLLEAGQSLAKPVSRERYRQLQSRANHNAEKALEDMDLEEFGFHPCPSCEKPTGAFKFCKRCDKPVCHSCFPLCNRCRVTTINRDVEYDE